MEAGLTASFRVHINIVSLLTYYGKRPNLTSFKGSGVPSRARLLLVHGSNFGQMPFLSPPMTHIIIWVPAEMEPRFTECKCIALTTEQVDSADAAA